LRAFFHYVYHGYMATGASFITKNHVYLEQSLQH